MEAHANLKRGPLNGLFNYTRRPLAAVTLSVVEPVTAEVKPEMTEMEIVPGSPVRVKTVLKNVPANARIELRGLPGAIQWREIERTADAVEFEILPPASEKAKTVAFTVEADVLGRWSASKEVQLKIAAAAAESGASSRVAR